MKIKNFNNKKLDEQKIVLTKIFITGLILCTFAILTGTGLAVWIIIKVLSN